MIPCPDYINFTFLNLVHILVRKVSLPLNYLLSVITLFINYVYIFVSIIVLKKLTKTLSKGAAKEICLSFTERKLSGRTMQ